MLLLVTYTRGLCGKICKLQANDRNKDKSTLSLCVLRLIRGISSAASVLLTPTNSPTILDFLCQNTKPPRSLVNLQAINWWRGWYLSPGKDSLPSDDLDSMLDYGTRAMQHIFASCLLLCNDDMRKTVDAEQRNEVVFEEDCDGMQLFDDDEQEPAAELDVMLQDRLDLVHYRDIALEAVES